MSGRQRPKKSNVYVCFSSSRNILQSRTIVALPPSYVDKVEAFIQAPRIDSQPQDRSVESVLIVSSSSRQSKRLDKVFNEILSNSSLRYMHIISESGHYYYRCSLLVIRRPEPTVVEIPLKRLEGLYFDPLDRIAVIGVIKRHVYKTTKRR